MVGKSPDRLAGVPQSVVDAHWKVLRVCVGRVSRKSVPPLGRIPRHPVHGGGNESRFGRIKCNRPRDHLRIWRLGRRIRPRVFRIDSLRDRFRRRSPRRPRHSLRSRRRRRRIDKVGRKEVASWSLLGRLADGAPRIGGRGIQATGIHVRHRVVQRVRVAIVRLTPVRIVNQWIRRNEPAGTGVVQPVLQIDEPDVGVLLLPDEAKADVRHTWIDRGCWIRGIEMSPEWVPFEVRGSAGAVCHRVD